MMHRLFNKQLSILVISLLCLVAAIIGMWRFTTLIQYKEDQVVTTKERLAAYDHNKKIFAEESIALAALNARATTLEAYQVTPATTPQLLSSLESLARMHGVEFAITTAQTSGTAKQKLLIDFSAIGTATQVDGFLTDLSHQSYEIAFTKFALSADATASSTAVQWNLLASIQIISF